jgi:hypothetical protein
MSPFRVICKCGWAYSRCYHSTKIATSGKHLHDPFEEEQLPWYKHDQFYPVHIGETFDSKYKVVGKLGYGVAEMIAYLGLLPIEYIRRSPMTSLVFDEQGQS